MFRLIDPQLFSVHQIYVSDIRLFQTIRFSQTFRTFVKLLMKSGTPRLTRDLTGHHSEILIQLKNEMVVSGMGQNRIQSPTTKDDVQ